MIRIIFGTDRYLVLKERALFRGKVNEPSWDEAYFTEFSDSTKDYIMQYPMFGNHKVAFIDVDDIKALDNKWFSSVVDVDPEYCYIIITINNVDKRLKLYKELKKKELLKEKNKLTSETALGNFIVKVAEKAGCTIAPDAVRELIRRVNYFVIDDIDLGYVYRVVLDCVSIDSDKKEISLDTVKRFVKDNEQDNIFVLTTMLNNKDIAGLSKQSRLMLMNTSFNPIGVLSLILKDYRKALNLQIAKKYGMKATCVDSRRPSSNIKIQDKSVLVRCINILTEAVASQKSSLIAKDQVMMLTFEQLLQAMN